MDYQLHDSDRYFPILSDGIGFGRREIRRILKLTDLLPEYSILEIGCASGSLLAALKELGFSRLSGVEPNPDMIEHGESELGIQIHQGTWRGFLEESGGTYDRIVALDVLEHIPKTEVQEVLNLSHQHLNPGGELILRMPCASSPAALPVFFGDLTHEFMTTPRTLSTLLRTAGFSEVRVVDVLPMGGLGAFLHRLLFYILVRPVYFLKSYFFHNEGPRVITANMMCVARKQGL